MKKKYIDEAFPTWFIFGEKDGLVDINDGIEDIATYIPKEQAEKLIEKRAILQRVIYEALDYIEKLDEKGFYDVFLSLRETYKLLNDEIK